MRIGMTLTIPGLAHLHDPFVALPAAIVSSSTSSASALRQLRIFLWVSECTTVSNFITATGEVLSLPMVGVVDLLIETDDGAVLVDFKTAARGGEPIEQQYEIQLGCYAAMYRELFRLPEADLEIHTLVKTRQPRIEVDRFESRSAQHFARSFAVLHEYVAPLDHGQFNYRPRTGCMFCNMRHEHCKAWSDHLPQFQNKEDLAWPKSS